MTRTYEQIQDNPMMARQFVVDLQAWSFNSEINKHDICEMDDEHITHVALESFKELVEDMDIVLKLKYMGLLQ